MTKHYPRMYYVSLYWTENGKQVRATGLVLADYRDEAQALFKGYVKPPKGFTYGACYEIPEGVYFQVITE